MSAEQTASDNFRTIIYNLPPPTRLHFEKVLQKVLAIKNLRNLQLQTRKGSREDNFVKTRQEPLEKAYRTNLVCLVSRFCFTSPKPTKLITFGNFENPAQDGLKLDEYLNDPFTGQFGFRFIFWADGWFGYEYFSDSDNDEACPFLDLNDVAELADCIQEEAAE